MDSTVLCSQTWTLFRFIEVSLMQWLWNVLSQSQRHWFCDASNTNSLRFKSSSMLHMSTKSKLSKKSLYLYCLALKVKDIISFETSILHKIPKDLSLQNHRSENVRFADSSTYTAPEKLRQIYSIIL
jgi:hypothetical protein